MCVRNLGRLKRLGKLNHFMQDFFIRWHRENGERRVSGCVDTSQMPLIREMNSRLKEELSNRDFYRRFEANIQQLETIACEIIDHSGVDIETPFRRANHTWVESDTFAKVLKPSPRQTCEFNAESNAAAV